MTRLRARVAERLKGAQNTYAMLTTFNEIDMTNIMLLRKDFKVVFAHVSSHLHYLAKDGKRTSQDLTHVQVGLVYQLDTGQSETCWKCFHLWYPIRHADTASKCATQPHGVVSSSQQHPAALRKAHLLLCCFRMVS